MLKTRSKKHYSGNLLIIWFILIFTTLGVSYAYWTNTINLNVTTETGSIKVIGKAATHNDFWKGQAGNYEIMSDNELFYDLPLTHIDHDCGMPDGIVGMPVGVYRVDLDNTVKLRVYFAVENVGTLPATIYLEDMYVEIQGQERKIGLFGPSTYNNIILDTVTLEDMPDIRIVEISGENTDISFTSSDTINLGPSDYALIRYEQEFPLLRFLSPSQGLVFQRVTTENKICAEFKVGYTVEGTNAWVGTTCDSLLISRNYTQEEANCINLYARAFSKDGVSAYSLDYLNDTGDDLIDLPIYEVFENGNEQLNHLDTTLDTTQLPTEIEKPTITPSLEDVTNSENQITEPSIETQPEQSMADYEKENSTNESVSLEPEPPIEPSFSPAYPELEPEPPIELEISTPKIDLVPEPPLSVENSSNDSSTSTVPTTDVSITEAVPTE